MSKNHLFPKNFFWGASTASHQVEGGTVNQWSVWELAHAKELADTAEKRLSGLPSWDRIKDQATDPDNYISGSGVDHLNRYEEDFDLLKSLNLNAFRFGIEWSRIEPIEGKWDEDAIKHYHAYIKALKKRGIEPFMNVWHWTMPTWFTDKGGFSKKANLKYFDRFIQKLAEEYGHELKYVITLNEPNVFTVFGYMTGDWPPNKKSYGSFFKVYWNLANAHRRAYRIFKDIHPEIQIGVAAQLANIQAKHPHNIPSALVTKWMRYFWNWWFLRRIRKEQDFIGFNYYFTDYYAGKFKRSNPTFPVSDLGWYMEPEGLYQLLISVWDRYEKPIFITENGLADANDTYRKWWIEQTIIAMQRALSDGVDIRGYLHWSLLDNFEWAYGWWPKFGLVEVDRQNKMKRTIRPSAKWYAQKVKELRNE